MATLRLTRDAGDEAVVPLAGTAAVVGSAEGADVTLEDRKVDGSHCRLENQDGKWSVEDLDSTGGTWVNGSMILGRQKLTDGDEIRVGATVMTLDLSAVAVPAPQPIAVAAATPVSAPHAAAALAPATAEPETPVVAVPAPSAASASRARAPVFAEDNGSRMTLGEHAKTEPHGRLQWRVAVSIALEVAQTLERAESQGVVHGGIDPDCLLLGRHEKWALAPAGEPWPGTDPAYFRAPEVLRDEPADHASDLYALGALLYWMIAGRTAFHDTPPAELESRIANGMPDPVYWVVPGLPKPVSTVIGKLMAPRPGARYRTAAAVSRDLENCTSTASVKVAPKPPRKKAGTKAGVIVAVVVIAVGALSVYKLFGGAQDAAADLGESAKDQAAALSYTLAAAGAPTPAPESAADKAAQEAAEAAVNAIDERASALGPLGPETIVEWTEIADAYEALLQKHSPDRGCIQQSYLRCRLIRTDLARLQANVAPTEEMTTAVDGLLARIDARVESADTDVLPAGIAESALMLPARDATSPETLSISWDATQRLLEGLRARNRTGEALSVAGLWLLRTRALAEEQPELRGTVQRAEQWLRRVATEEAAVLSSDLGSDVRLLCRAYAATRLAENGVPLADDDGEALRFGKALYALDGVLPLLRTPALSERAKARHGRIYAALETWSAILASVPEGLVKDGQPLTGIPGKDTVFVDAGVTPSLGGLPVRAGEEAGSTQSVIPWASIPTGVIAREFVLPFAARSGHSHHEGAVWLLVCLERPDEAQIALDLSKAIAPGAAAGLRAEVAALMHLETLAPKDAPDLAQTLELIATDSGLARRPDLAAHWEKLLRGQGISSLLDSGSGAPSGR